MFINKIKMTYIKQYRWTKWSRNSWKKYPGNIVPWSKDQEIPLITESLL